MKISIIMPVCCWPVARSVEGAHPYLPKSLDSILAGGHKNVEVLIGVDGTAGEDIGTGAAASVIRWALCNGFDRMDYLSPDHGNAVRFANEEAGIAIFAYRFPFQGKFGNPQRNKLLGEARGDVVCFMDQDDSFFPGALAGVARICGENPGLPLIFRMEHPRRGADPFVLWKQKGLVEESHIGGHMLVVPNVKEKLARWEPEDAYAADFQFIKNTLANFPPAVWSEEFIARIRPWEVEL